MHWENSLGDFLVLNRGLSYLSFRARSLYSVCILEIFNYVNFDQFFENFNFWGQFCLPSKTNV